MQDIADYNRELPSTAVPFSTYRQFSHAGGNCASIFFFVVCCLVSEFLDLSSEYMIAAWTESQEAATSHNIIGTELLPFETFRVIYIYAGFIGGLFVFSVMKNMHFFRMCTSASVVLHNRMLHCIMHAPLRFFDRNSTGKTPKQGVRNSVFGCTRN